MSNRIADTSLQLNSQALAVLQILANREPTFADYANGRYDIEIGTYAWYNGRERGFSLVVTRLGKSRTPLVCTVFEHRKSDDLCVLSWEPDRLFLNAPTIECWNRHKKATGDEWDPAHFEYGDVGNVVEYIYYRMDSWYTAQKEQTSEMV